MSARPRPSCYQKAIELIAPRPHFRRELTVKLRRRGYDDDEVGATLGRLEDEGLLDELETARAFVRKKLRGAPMGRLRLRAELARRGVDDGVAAAALADLDEDDREPTREAAERWLARDRREPGEARSAALARYLKRRGFTDRAIVAVLRDEA